MIEWLVSFGLALFAISIGLGLLVMVASLAFMMLADVLKEIRKNGNK